MPEPHLIKLLALIALLSVAVYTDLLERRIPNWLTVSGLLTGMALTSFEVGGFPTTSVLGAALALVLAFPLFALGGVGAGDVKLLVAVTAFTGAAGLLPMIIYGGLAGGILALASAVRRGVVLGVLINSWSLIVHLMTLGRRGERLTLATPGAHSVPYGVAIAAGAVATWFFPISIGGAL
jgi:prepilin peptidase CpaA